MPNYDPLRGSRGKQQFISRVLRESANKIEDRQGKIVDDWDLYESGTLKSSLTGHFNIDETDGSNSLTFRYLVYARFLDMPDPRRRTREFKREGYHLYNKTLFGIIYNQALPNLLYGYTAELRETATEVFNNAFEGDPHIAALFVRDAQRKGIINKKY